ncbi:MAG: hypothetical protein QOD81_4090 [Solirubrobacteraceae bacterium]|nr:hypothetical protein [Solirubrobacteraceae bacterium]
MNAAMSTSSRGTRSASIPRSTSGNVAVAPRSTALSVPMPAFAATAAKARRPSSWTVSGPSAYAAPPGRANGSSAAASSTSGSTTRQRRHTAPADTRAATA